MNTLLDSPLEPLSIDCLSYRYGLSTAVNNIWAWVAFITAAVGLWRIRGFSSPPCQNSGLSAFPSSSPERNSASNEAATAAERPAAVSPPGSATTSYMVLESEGSPKGKFSVYYNDDMTGIDNAGDGEGDGGAAEWEKEELGWWCGDDWERAVVVRMGDMGWYRFQDLTVLDGNVVRLWDRRPAAESRGRWCGMED